MTDEWYYWHDVDVLGPFTGQRLADLAAAGRILPTDTVWRAGVERGVPAGTVKHLFAPTPTAPIGAEAALLTVPANAGGVATSDELADVPKPSATSDEQAPTPSSWFSGSSGPTTTRRATAGKGAIIVGQDGTTVKFRKKCTTCGYEDSSWRSIPITRGTTRVSFYCPKCRHTRAVEVLGHVS